MHENTGASEMGSQADMSELKRVRVARCWSHGQALSALSAQAKTAGVVIAEPSSLRVMLARWEAGAQEPTDVHRRLLRQIYQPEAEGGGE